MKLSETIWNELGPLASVIEMIDHEAGTVKFRAGTSQADQDAVAVIIAAHDPAKKSAPATVTMRQARLALLQSGLLSQVNSAVASADEATQITWDYSSEVHRNHPFVATLAAALSLSEAQLDGLFTLAASL